MKLSLQIDESNLIVEWQGQANLMLDYGIQLADAGQEADEAAARLDVVAARLDTAIRADPAAFGLAKTTESTVQAAVAVQPEHIEARQALLTARHDREVLKAAVNAIQHRKSALQGMTDLWLRQWHGDPRSTEQPQALRDSVPPSKPPTKRRRRKVE